MNLARVEYYLSDYLSIIESRKKVGKDIITDNIVEYQEDNENIRKQIPDKLIQIGTVNFFNPMAGKEIIEEMELFCKEQGIKDINEIVGII